MSVTFAVDEVEAAPTPPATRRYADVFPGAMFVAGNADARVVDHEGVHPLVAAVHCAFAEHRSLVLSPDAVWLTIAQGLAQHVRLNAEQLRPRLVKHVGRARISIHHDGPMPTNADAWATFVSCFRAHVDEQMGAGFGRLLTCDFSTTSDVDRVASEIVLLDAVSAYFDFQVTCICGIPRITLLGTPADWRRIRGRVPIIRELEAKTWADSLEPILDHFVRASEGEVELKHWQRIYKPRKAYGWDRVTGWVARLYPYLLDEGRVRAENPLLALPIDQPNDGNDEDWYQGPGVALGQVPSTHSVAFVRVVDAQTGTTSEVQLEGGLLAVAVDEEGRLRPISGYLARERASGILEVLDRIESDHTVVRGSAGSTDSLGSAELTALADRFESATLWSGSAAWHILGPAERSLIELTLPNGQPVSLMRLIDLPCDRCIACSSWSNSTVYVLCDVTTLETTPQVDEGAVDEITLLPMSVYPTKLRERYRRSTQPAEEVTILGPSIAAVLTYALDHGGALLPGTGASLIDELPEWLVAPPKPPPPRPSKRRSQR